VLPIVVYRVALVADQLFEYVGKPIEQIQVVVGLADCGQLVYETVPVNRYTIAPHDRVVVPDGNTVLVTVLDATSDVPQSFWAVTFIEPAAYVPTVTPLIVILFVVELPVNPAGKLQV
jgi:hypothetical protein